MCAALGMRLASPNLDPVSTRTDHGA